jgi:hypothetical protein
MRNAARDGKLGIVAAICAIPQGKLQQFVDGDDAALSEAQIECLAFDLKQNHPAGEPAAPVAAAVVAEPVVRGDVDLAIQRRLAELAAQCQKLHEEANALCKGKSVKVVSNFNGQEFGRSKKSLRGEALLIEYVCLYEDGRYSFTANHPRVDAGFGPDDVEFV